MIIKNNKVYDVLKVIALVWLPAFVTFYLTVSGIWDLPYAKQVAGTITAFATLLGALLGISSKQYKEAQEEDLK